MLRVCHVTSVHKSIDQRIFAKECCSLQQNGYKVFLVAPGASYIKMGVTICGIEPQGKTRFYRMLTFSRFIIKKAIEVNADIYHFHDPELLPYAIKFKKKGKKVIFDAHEDLLAQIKQKKWIPYIFRNVIANTVNKYQHYVFKHIDAVITVNDNIKKSILVSNKKTVVITNYPIISDMDLKNSYSYNRSICFVGGISSNAQHELVISALNDCSNVKYILCGDISDAYLRILKSKLGWNNVEFKGCLSYINVKKVLAESGIGMAILPYNATDGGKIGTIGNTKLFEYMLAGIPVICTDFITWKEIVETEECGIAINPYDIQALENSITYLLNHPEIAKKMGENGRRAIVEKYNWEVEEKKLLLLYVSLVRSEKI